MRSLRIPKRIKAAFYFIAFLVIIMACGSQQGTMHEGGGSMNMGNWNGALILLGIIIIFLLGYFVGRRRK